MAAVPGRVVEDGGGRMRIHLSVWGYFLFWTAFYALKGLSTVQLWYLSITEKESCMRAPGRSWQSGRSTGGGSWRTAAGARGST